MRKKVLIIYNPCSGMKGFRKKPDDFYLAFPFDKYNIELISTKKKLDATSIAREKSDDFDIIVCAGGDGTFNEVINGVAGKFDTILVYYPNGTTNDSAKTLGISRSIKKTVDLINNGFVNKVDVGTMNDRNFFCTVSFGYGSNASLKTKQSLKNEIGKLAYILTSVENAADIKPVQMDIDCDGESFSGKFIFGAVLNTISVGGVFRLDENTFRLNDGMFELILVPKVSGIVEIPNLLAMLQRKQYDDKHIIFRRCKEIKFKSDKKIPWLIDGENGGLCDDVTIKNMERALNICSPKNKFIK